MNNPKHRKLYAEICPICGVRIKKTYSHYMKHVEEGQMTHEIVEVKTIKHVFKKKSA